MLRQQLSLTNESEGQGNIGPEGRAQAAKKCLIERSLRSTPKKIVDVMGPQDNVELQSMTPVFCSFGGEPGTGFPAFMPTSEVFMIGETPFRVVMIPTAPIPFGGAIICVPKEWVTPMYCGIDGLLNMYMSMGTTVPQHFNKASSAS